MSVARQLQRAREGLRLPLEEAADRLGVEPDRLEAWEEGRQEPRFDELCELAGLYLRSVDYFLEDIRPARAPLALRLAAGQPELSREAREVLVQWEELCRSRAQLEKVLGEERDISMPKSPGAQDPVALAQGERRRLDLGTGPVEDLRAVLERQGPCVFELPFRTKEFSGASQWHEEYGPCILVNAREIMGRRNFTMAHEYYHLLVRGEQPHVCAVELGAEATEERSANRFAAALLMTPKGLEPDLRAGRERGPLRDPKDYAPLARKWRVSVEALLWALKDFGLLPRQEAERLLAEWRTPEPRFRAAKGKPRPPQWKRRLQHLGEPYTKAALRAHESGRISLSKLAEYLGIDIREAREAAEAPP